MNPKYQKAQGLLRRLGLLRAADHVRYYLAIARSRRDNQRFRREFPDFQMPPAHLAYDAYGYVRWRDIKASGEIVAQQIADVITEFAPEWNHTGRIFEWGCGPGRVVRHLPSLFPNTSIYGTDYNPKSIEWCIEHVANVHFGTNMLHPPLSFDEHFFDFIYAISVMTHLSESSCHEWIQELARVSKPNALLLLWTNGDVIASKLLPEEQKLYRAGEFIERTQYQEGKKFYLSFHPASWVSDELLTEYSVLKHWVGGFSGKSQDVWLVQQVGSHR